MCTKQMLNAQHRIQFTHMKRPFPANTSRGGGGYGFQDQRSRGGGGYGFQDQRKFARPKRPATITGAAATKALSKKNTDEMYGVLCTVDKLDPHPYVIK